MTQNDNACETSSSASSRNLRVDFYESGRGDTVVVSFPDGGVGIVDAHPSPSGSRPDILEIIGDKRVHFVCLTHPHADHGIDLVPVLRRSKAPEGFWHTASEINAFVYRVSETVSFDEPPQVVSFPSQVREWARRLAKGWADFHIDVFGAVFERKIPIMRVNAGLAPQTIDGVQIYFLGPEEKRQNSLIQHWLEKASDPSVEEPDRNLLSAIIALRLGDSVALLGADALRANWTDAVARYRKHRLPKAIVLKVPHHGAANAIDLGARSGSVSYLDLCRHEQNFKCHAVLFAGDARHPNPRVLERLRARTRLFCTANGTLGVERNPLGIELDGARAVGGSVAICNPVVSFEMSPAGTVTVFAGDSCEECPHRN